MFPFACRCVGSVGFSHLDVPSMARIAPGADADGGGAPRGVIGVVAFATHRGEPAEAVLDAQGRWSCPKLPVLDRVLNALHAPKPSPGGDKPFGHAELIRVAAWLKGEARIRR